HVIRQRSQAAIGHEVSVQAEVLRAQEGHPERSALASVVDLAVLPHRVQPAVDTSSAVHPYQTGVDLTERRPEVRELPVGSGGTRDGGKPVVAHEIVLGEGSQSRELLGTEA